MLKTYFIDGDKGGVGKSFTARAVADMLIQSTRFGLPKIERLLVVDADQANQDVCGPGGFCDETVGDCDISILMRGIENAEQWISVGNEVFERIQDWPEDGEGRIVFSLPAGAGLTIARADEVTELMSAMNAINVWVLGTDFESVRQLQERLDRFPKFYERGFVILNLRHGSRDKFVHWNNSDTKKAALESGWREIEMPVLTPMVATALSRTPLHRADPRAIGMGSMIALKTFRGVAGERLSLMEKEGL